MPEIQTVASTLHDFDDASHKIYNMTDSDEVNISNVFIPPSVKAHLEQLYTGLSYSYFSNVPRKVTKSDIGNGQEGTPCVLGVDEAGRGPVIGPMVYGVFYLPVELHQSLLADTHHFDDSKVLTPAVRAALTQKVCTPDTDLHENCGWAINSLSAQDISGGMLKNGGSYNLNAQAMDATVETIKGVLERGVNLREIYVDTIGQPAVYQKKLERIFPTIKITVEKKADSLYPCVSAASVMAKVTRDVSCEMLFEQFERMEGIETSGTTGWGSGYPSDARCVSWLKGSINPVFGWGNECRFSWGTVKDMLELKGGEARKTDWPTDEETDNMKVSQYFSAGQSSSRTETEELRDWYGSSTGQEVF